MEPQPHDDLEPKRIGRSTREGLGPAQRLRSSTTGTSAQRGTGTAHSRGPGPRSLSQRVVVKVRVVRHRSPQKGRDSLRRHIGYLQREAAMREPGAGRFYDAKRDELNAKQDTRSWREDRHHFRVIVSPENGSQIHELRDFVRKSVRQMERDLGALEWLAVNHTNTDNPHAHLLIRGRTERGTDLVIPRDYIARGMRMRAEEVATELLGERSRDEARASLVRESEAERFTSLDRTLRRHAQTTTQGLRIDLTRVRLSRYALTSTEHLRARLKVLQQMGLARHVPPPKHLPLRGSQTWLISPDFEPRLRELAIRNDIIKQLHRTLGARAPDAVEIAAPSKTAESTPKPPRPVRGVLLGKTALDEQSDERLLVVDSRRGPRYARVWADRTLDAAQPGGVVEVGRGAARSHAVMREVIAVSAEQPDSRYTTAAHRTWLREHRSKLRPERVERRLRSISKAVVRLARQPGSGVSRVAENAVVIDREKLRRFTVQRARRLDVRVMAPHALASQIRAEAYTWLDRQLIRTRVAEALPKSDVTQLDSVRSAMQERAAWLVERKYAERDASTGRSDVRFHFGAIEQLKAAETKKFAQDCKERHGKGFSMVGPRQTVPGVYVGLVELHQGRFALVATREMFYGVPVSREPRLQRGDLVTARVVNNRHTTWERRTPGKTIGLDRE